MNPRQIELNQDTRHYHGWVLQIEGTRIWFEPIPGEYEYHMAGRRQALKATDGQTERIVVMICNGGETCPTNVAQAEPVS